MKYRLPVFVRIGFWVFAVIIIGLIGVYYQIEKQAVQQEAEENLIAIARLKIDQVVAWRKDRLLEGAEILSRPRILNLLTERLADDRQDEIHNILIEELKVFRHQHKIENILLVSADGAIRASLEGPLEDPEQLALELTTGFRDRMPVLTELHTDKAYPEPHISVVAPLFFDQEKTRPAGTVILIYDPSQFLYPLIQSWPARSESAETLLVRRDGDDVLFLNTVRHQVDTALNLRIPLSQSDLPAAMAIKGKRGVATGNDYRGVKVVSVLMPVPKSSWFLVAKVDEEEIFAPWRSRALLIIGLLSCLLAMLWAFALVVRQFEQKRQYMTLYQTEAEMRAITERHSVTLKSIGDAVIVTDAQGNVELLNSVAEKLTGWSDEEANGRSLEDVFQIFDEHSRTPVENPAFKVVREGMVVGLANHSLLKHKNGSERPIADSGAPIYNSAGEITGVVLVFRDQSEDRAYQNKILESESRFRAVFDQAGVGIARLDLSLRFEAVNAVHCAILGYSEKDLVGSSVLALMHPDDQMKYRQQIDEILAGNANSFTLENREIKKDGQHLWVRVTVSVIQNESGQPNSFISVIEDISDRKLAEDAIMELNETLEQKVAERTRIAESRNRQLQTLAVELIETEERERRRISAILHDDLQQILAAARMQIEAVCDDQRHERTLSNIKQLIDESIGKSRRLSHELSPPVLRHSDLAASLQWISRHFNEQFGLQVELIIEETPHQESRALKVFVFRAVQELLFNIVKHAGVKNARVVLSIADGFQVITVSDQGPGIDPNVLYSATPLSGLGLLSLQERAQYIGGSFLVESDPGLGSRFTLKVPFSIDKGDERRSHEVVQRSDIPIEKVSASDTGITHVLFVDDHKVMRQGLINLIGSQPGIRVVGEASNGQEAIDRVAQLKPEVVVMDVSMPVMDGMEATRRIKAEWPKVRVIALSMVEDEHTCQTMIDAGAEAFVSKTASLEELLKAIFGLTQDQ